jgi:outer membrane protein assembly factor BamB
VGSQLWCQDWPQFRGPGRTDRSDETGLLKEWPKEGPPKLWSASGLGEGYSAISAKDGRIYTMGSSEGKEAVFALEFSTGKILWTAISDNRVFEESRGNGPRCTPTTDDTYLYTEGALGSVTCWEAESGKQVWKVSLTKDLGGRVPPWAYTESPLILGKAVIVTPGGGKGAIAALDKKTGQVIWQSKEVKTGAAYSSPIFATIGNQRQIINGLAKRMVGVDADSGKYLWEYTEPCPDIYITTPIEHDGLVFATADYQKGSGVVKITPEGAQQVWYDKSFGNHHGGVILVGEYLYGFFDDMRCVEMKTGKVVWQNRSVGKGSLTYADGHFYCLSEGRTVALVEATSDGYKETSRFKFAGPKRPSWPHPVVVGGRLFIRDQDTLHCWDVKAK